MIQIVGSGGCGFMRAYNMLKSYMPISFKGGKRKFQNYFEIWDSEKDLIWETDHIDGNRRKILVRQQGKVNNISHIAIRYVEEFLDVWPDTKFLCLKGNRDLSIKCLLTSWGYNNPCFVSDRSLGIGHNRYPVAQFPDLSDSKDDLEATSRYWDDYYQLANLCEKKFSGKFLVVESERLFRDEHYQKAVLEYLGIKIPFYYNPIDTDRFDISTTLHGGIGNNLFQMAETISFCEKYGLPRPFFGTWDMSQTESFPTFYDSDKFLGGHDGSHEDLMKTFSRLDWRGSISPNIDVKFVVTDMYRFGNIDFLSQVRNLFTMKTLPESERACLHLRFCTRSADDHVNGFVPDSFYEESFTQIPDGTKVWVFSDDLNLARQKVDSFIGRYRFDFEIKDQGTFETLEHMSACKYMMMHVSTFSFWGAFLGPHGFEKNVFCPSSFISRHGTKMISPLYGWKII